MYIRGTPTKNNGLTNSSGVFTNNSGTTMTLIVIYNAFLIANIAEAGFVAYIFNHSVLGAINTQILDIPNNSQSTGSSSQTITLLNGESFRIQFYQNSGSTVTLSSTSYIAIQRIS